MMSKFKDRFQLTPDVSSTDKALEAFTWVNAQWWMRRQWSHFLR